MITSTRFTLAHSALVILLPGVLVAQPDIGLKKVGGFIGIADPEGVGSTLTLGPKIEMGTLMPALHWNAEIGYWSKGRQGVELSDLFFMSSVDYRFQTSLQPLSLFAGAGLSLHFVSASIDVGLGKTSASETDLALHLEGGVNYLLNSKVELFSLLRLVVSDVDQTQFLIGALYLF